MIGRFPRHLKTDIMLVQGRNQAVVDHAVHQMPRRTRLEYDVCFPIHGWIWINELDYLPNDAGESYKTDRDLEPLCPGRCDSKHGVGANPWGSHPARPDWS